MKLTREGKRFLLATVLIAVAAVNTGNNLIYLILALMLSFVFISFVALKINLSRLSLEVSVEGPVFAGEVTSVNVAMTNGKKIVPAYSVRISGPGVSDHPYFAYIHPGQKVAGKMDMTFPRRGLHSYGEFRVKSGFPFILLSSEEKAEVQGEVLVYPALLDIGNEIGLLPAGIGQVSAKSAGTGDEIFSIREFRVGDDWRKIHWKASAKADALLVREFAEGEVMKITLFVDNLDTRRVRDNISRRESPLKDHCDADFEKMVSVSVSLAKHFLNRGYHVRVVTCRKVIPFGSGDEHFFKILDVFALMSKEDGCDNVFPPGGEGLSVSVVPTAAHPSAFGLAGDKVVYADSL